MSHDTTNEPGNVPQKGKEPDFDVLQAIGKGDRERLQNIGAMWLSERSGCISGETAHGRIVLKPRATQADLETLRAEQRQSTEQAPEQEISH
jgi:hypothetical protein